ncbi:MAG: cupin domain-containing protein [Bryobacteraceae bacterium]
MAPTATPVKSSPGTLNEILEPVSAEEFLTRYLGKEYFYCPGQPGKFAGLLPWADLNQILEHHRLDVPRLRLVREGKPIPASAFLQYRSSRRVPRVRSAELTRYLQEGATLILDAMDELQPPIAGLVENLERQLSSRLQVNMYAGWRSSRGFDLHWDGHDVLILQVSGRKLWKVYSKTDNGNAPATPLWEGTLNDGDLLYIPRGWWHVAIPLDEPTLHLTVGLHQPTGVDLLAWFTDRLKSSPAVDRDLPRYGTPDEKRAYLNQMRDTMTAHWNAELLDEYFAHADARVQTRPHFSLPWTTTPPGDDWSVKWIVPRQVDLTPKNNSVQISAKGKQWTFAAAAAPLLCALQETGTCTIRDLQGNYDLSPAVVRSFVSELIGAGLVTVVPNVLL